MRAKTKAKTKAKASAKTKARTVSKPLHAERFPGESKAYRSARDRLLRAEMELRSRVEQVAAMRRKLPLGGVVPQDYEFEEGAADPADTDSVRRVKLSELFHPGKDTLIIYSFMYGPNMAKACPMCTCMLDSLDGNAPHAAQRTNLVVVAKSRIERIREFGRGRGWRNLRLLSSAGNSYNRDYRGETAEGAQLPSLNVFVKRGDKIHHIYNTELMFAPRTKGQDARHVDAIWPLWNLLDFTPEGRGADWYPKLEYGAVEGGKQTLSRLAAHIAEDFLISRLVDAPRDKIWRYWTEPERLAAWFGPKGFETITAKLDFRPDGVYHYCMRGNGVDMWGKWTFREIDAPGKLVFINAFSDKDGGLGRHPLAPTWPAQMVTTALFSDFGPKTLITVQWSPYEANEVERKTFSDGMASMNQGWSGTFERLDAYLEQNR